jgi:hypothetical protein
MCIEKITNLDNPSAAVVNVSYIFKYSMLVKVWNGYRNSGGDNYDDKWWYYDINVRIIPKTEGVLLYTGAGFATQTSRVAYEIHRLEEQIANHHEVYFKLAQDVQVPVGSLEFVVGLYAQEVRRDKDWTTLSPS